MRISMRKQLPGELRYGVIYGLLALAALTAARLLPLGGLLPDCVFQRLTHHPCPTCGATRAITALSTGEVSEALRMNPLATLALLLALGALVMDLVLVMGSFRRPVLSLSLQEGNRVRAAAIAVVLLNWAYLAGAR